MDISETRHKQRQGVRSTLGQAVEGAVGAGVVEGPPGAGRLGLCTRNWVRMQ